MRYGFIGTFGTAQEILTLAAEAERAGWDAFFYWDGISVGPMDTFDPWVLLGAVAARTERVLLGAIINPLSRRRPWKVARETLTLDHVSGGRAILPVGLGAVDDGGFTRVSDEPTDRRDRAARLDETLEFLDLAWQGEPFSFTGQHYQSQDLVFRPRPIQRPRIPIWVVALHPNARSMGRAARYDGVLPNPGGGPEPEYGPDFVRDVVGWLADHRDPQLPPSEVVMEGTSPIGDLAAAAAQVSALADAGATWWIESMWSDPCSPDDLLARVRQGPPR